MELGSSFCNDHSQPHEEDKPTKGGWVEWLQKLRGGNDGNDEGYERERGRVLPDEQKKDRDNDRGGRGR